MSLYSTKLLDAINQQFEHSEFDSIEDVCVNIYLADAVFRVCFIIDEDEDLITFLATDSEGKEKVKVVNKDYIQSIEIYYLDDELAFNVDEQIDDMFN